MQRALGASEPPGLPMIKPQPSPSKDAPVAPSQGDIPKPVTPKNEFSNVPATNQTGSPVLSSPTKKVTTTAVLLPDKTAPTTIIKTDVSVVLPKPSGETTKLQPGAAQQSPKEISRAKSAPPSDAEVGKPSPQKPPKTATSPAKSAPPPAQPAKQESGGFFGFGGGKTQPTAAKPAESVTGKMFGFGSSFLSSASTLITSAVQDEPKTTPPTPRKLSSTGSVSPKTTPAASPKTLPAKDTKPPVVQKPDERKPEKPHQEKIPSSEQAKVDKAPLVLPKVPGDIQGTPNVDLFICPLCKVKLSIDSKEPPSYSTCTECKTTVCNLCGFTPMPNVAEVNSCHQFV